MCILTLKFSSIFYVTAIACGDIIIGAVFCNVKHC